MYLKTNDQLNVIYTISGKIFREIYICSTALHMVGIQITFRAHFVGDMPVLIVCYVWHV
jgi:hypothetical protein